MTVPVMVVTGFLGAGKTTFINHLLMADHGERIAAIVNDFGAINIDAELLQDAADSVIGLRNGCICCSLQGDLLRTLRLVLEQRPQPERIVIEASGAADPRGIAEMVMDPVLWGAVSLDAVVCVIDAQEVADTPARVEDPLWQAQTRHADFALLSKSDAIPSEVLARLSARLAAEGKPVFDLGQGLPLDLLLGSGDGRDRPPPAPGRVSADRFCNLEWVHAGPVSQTGFQRVLQEISPGLLRAKGFLAFAERPDRIYLLQLVGRRASFRPVTQPDPRGCRLVLIGDAGTFDASRARMALETLSP